MAHINRHVESIMDGASLGGETGLPLRELEAQITELAGHLNAANYRWLNLIAEFDRRKGWSDSVTQSCAHWLNRLPRDRRDPAVSRFAWHRTPRRNTRAEIPSGA